MATVREAAGPDARDCGSVSLGKDRANAVSCSNTALGEHRSFSVVFQVMGIDSTIYIGLARRRAGQAEQLTWDSHVSGGYGLIARRRIFRRPCPGASIQDSEGVAPIVCAE